MSLQKQNNRHLYKLLSNTEILDGTRQWYDDVLPDFREETSDIEGVTLSPRENRDYSFFLNAEINLLLENTTGSYKEVMNAIKTDKWSKVLKTLMDHHLMPLLLASRSNTLRRKLMLRDWRDLRYITLTSLEKKALCDHIVNRKKPVKYNLARYLLSDGGTGSQLRIKEKIFESACALGYKDLFEELIGLFTDDKEINIHPMYTGFYEAVTHGHRGILERLLDITGLKNLFCYDYDEGLITAGTKDNREILILLLTHEACILSDYEYYVLFERSIKESIPALAERLIVTDCVDIRYYQKNVPISEGKWIIAMYYKIYEGGHTGYCSDPSEITDDEGTDYIECSRYNDDPFKGFDEFGIPLEGRKDKSVQWLIDNYSREEDLSSYSNCFGGSELQGTYDGDVCESTTYKPLRAIAFLLPDTSTE